MHDTELWNPCAGTAPFCFKTQFLNVAVQNIPKACELSYSGVLHHLGGWGTSTISELAGDGGHPTSILGLGLVVERFSQRFAWQRSSATACSTIECLRHAADSHQWIADAHSFVIRVLWQRNLLRAHSGEKADLRVRWKSGSSHVVRRLLVGILQGPQHLRRWTQMGLSEACCATKLLLRKGFAAFEDCSKCAVSDPQKHVADVCKLQVSIHAWQHSTHAYKLARLDPRLQSQDTRTCSQRDFVIQKGSRRLRNVYLMLQGVRWRFGKRSLNPGTRVAIAILSFSLSLQRRPYIDR